MAEAVGMEPVCYGKRQLRQPVIKYFELVRKNLLFPVAEYNFDLVRTGRDLVSVCIDRQPDRAPHFIICPQYRRHRGQYIRHKSGQRMFAYVFIARRNRIIARYVVNEPYAQCLSQIGFYAEPYSRLILIR